jgi:hypothetical protein
MDVHRQKLQSFDPDIANAIGGEERRQADGVEMIPSENYAYPEVLAALGSVLTNKYSEGYPGRRYYGGQEFTDQIEELARTRACALFRAEHANRARLPAVTLFGHCLSDRSYGLRECPSGLYNWQEVGESHDANRGSYGVQRRRLPDNSCRLGAANKPQRTNPRFDSTPSAR